MLMIWLPLMVSVETHEISSTKRKKTNDPFAPNGLIKTMAPLSFEEVVEVLKLLQGIAVKKRKQK